MEYLRLAKPGIVISNALVAAAAFTFASRSYVGFIDWEKFAFVLVGLMAIIAAACTFNSIADVGIDARMERTKDRPLPSGAISLASARLYGAALFLVGVVLLLLVNFLALGAALGGFIVYVFLYTPLKPKNPGALFVGAIAGATPPLVGYVAAANAFDEVGLALFWFMFLWQLPHFWAIARYRYDEYAAAGVPLWAKRPVSNEERLHARRIFYGSLVVLLLFCAALFLL